MLDYEVIADSRLTGQFTLSTKLRALVAAIVRPLTTLENEIDLLGRDRWIETAIGKQLDGCGYIVGEKRRGRTDAAYREAIKFRIFVNTSQGTPFALMYGLKALTKPTDAQYQEAYPATVLLFTNGFFVDFRIQSLLQDLAPAGIRTIPIAVSFASKAFRFSREPAPGELFVNNNADYLQVAGSDLQVSQGAIASSSSRLGGAVPAELDVGIGYLDVGGPTLAVYNPNTLQTLGHNNLTGVFQ